MIYNCIFGVIFACISLFHMKCGVKTRALCEIAHYANFQDLPKLITLKTDKLHKRLEIALWVVLGLGIVFCPWYYPVIAYVLSVILFYFFGAPTSSRIESVLRELHQIACQMRQFSETTAKTLLDTCNLAIERFNEREILRLKPLLFPIDVYNDLLELSKTDPQNANIVARYYLTQYVACCTPEEIDLFLTALAEISREKPRGSDFL